MIRCAKNPWFSLGIHIDHKAPYVAFHLPGVVISVGRTAKPWYSRTLYDDLLLLSPNEIDPKLVLKLKRTIMEHDDLTPTFL
jgi:hypothetical protein